MGSLFLKRGALCAATLLALALAGGCQSDQKSCARDEEFRAAQLRGHELARSAPCHTQGCKHGSGHGGPCCDKQPSKPQEPIVIKEPCDKNDAVVVEGATLESTYGVTVIGSLTYQDWVKSCDGKTVCKGDPRTVPVNGEVSMPLRAKVGPFAIPVNLAALPNEKPCDQKKDEPKKE